MCRKGAYDKLNKSQPLSLLKRRVRELKIGEVPIGILHGTEAEGISVRIVSRRFLCDCSLWWLFISLPDRRDGETRQREEGKREFWCG